MALTNPDTVRDPDWWLLRLGRQLRDRQKQLAERRRWYLGPHKLPQGPRGATDAFYEFQKKSETNFCRSVVRATANRTLALGINDEDGRADKQAWTWWQRSRMDREHRRLIRCLLSTAWAYTMVGPHPRDAKRPLITVEDPREVIHENDPATGEPAAVLKAWWDSIDRVGKATVFVEGQLFRYVTKSWSPLRPLPWGASSWTATEDTESRSKRPPVTAFELMPDVGETPEPDFWAGVNIQDRLNLSVFNRMTIERYAAFPQKTVTGQKLKKEIDSITGLEVPVNPYRPGPDAVWVAESEHARFAQLPAADLIGVLKAHEFDIRTLLVLTSTPAYAFPADLVNVSTDTVMALDGAHIAKVLELCTTLGEGLEDMFGIASVIAGDERDFSAHEMRWADPRQLNPGVLADMGVKKKNMGYPLTMVAEDMGESPQRVERLRTEAAAEAMLTAPMFQQPGQQALTTPTAAAPAPGPLQPSIPAELQGLA